MRCTLIFFIGQSSKFYFLVIYVCFLSLFSPRLHLSGMCSLVIGEVEDGKGICNLCPLIDEREEMPLDDQMAGYLPEQALLAFIKKYYKPLCPLSL